MIKLLQWLKNILKRFLPPPTKTVLRETQGILDEVTKRNRELVQLIGLQKEELKSIQADIRKLELQTKELKIIQADIRKLSWGNHKLSSASDSYAYQSSIPAERYAEELCKWYYQKTGDVLNLVSPKTFNEKIQWMKLYDSTPLKTRLADKYLVREWVADKIGEEYLIPLLGVWDSFDEIDFDKLPDQFVLKANHGSGWNIIVKDKSEFDKEEAKKKFDKWLNINFEFVNGLELHYMNIPPKIIAEQYMENLDQLYDYKIWCSNGNPNLIWVDIDRYTNHKRTVYTLDWEKLPVRIMTKYQVGPELPKPKTLSKMLQYAELLSKDFAQVRVDFYEVDGKLYFGEMTFTSESGTSHTEPKEFEYEMGSWITLPEKSAIPQRML